ncbi:PadR family transcriptional regulator [Nocardia farcinica]|uniref:Transcriptional regulator PadR-like family n=1 Tax=Nocardia farcinica TaxID=37329 RepID=A0A0H5NHQ3_NOCFR|nr:MULTISPECIES: PadR family transcriptional regulator [Nocardia]AXK84427.1 PadR family transcriptional regulator [Nocardia farcinica]MBA4856389.1 PadR family transcriptional regulator [Nocardia farcinica]MBC9814215.1 PadR family transcriptional regulator [Nocardia farcinica]MBF6069703.1 PadR family transcriptional regulator [Nocardia farcinica]MBF6139209.1 PadR family transcriptional regulator [Nocardia farcinica]
MSGRKARAVTANGRKPLNSTAASLLGFLHEGPMSGWDLVTVAQERIGDFWTITQSQVYRELAAMAEAGLVEKGEAGARDRTPYHLTEAGRAAFLEWVVRDPGAETIRVPLLLTMHFGRHVDPERLAVIIAANREIHQARLNRYLAEECAGMPPHQRATLEFGIGYERAVLAWFDRLPELLGT